MIARMIVVSVGISQKEGRRTLCGNSAHVVYIRRLVLKGVSGFCPC